MEHMFLNLGCGQIKKDGYLNCDYCSEINPDMVVDLEKPLPFDDDSIEGVYARHVFEHVNNFIPLMHELFRICKSGAEIEIFVPFYSSYGQFNDPTHVRFFTPFTFDYFNSSNFSYEVCKCRMFENVETRINCGFEFFKPMKWLSNFLVNLNHKIYCRLFAWIFPASEIYFKLRVL